MVTLKYFWFSLVDQWYVSFLEQIRCSVAWFGIAGHRLTGNRRNEYRRVKRNWIFVRSGAHHSSEFLAAARVNWSKSAAATPRISRTGYDSTRFRTSQVWQNACTISSRNYKIDTEVPIKLGDLCEYLQTEPPIQPCERKYTIQDLIFIDVWTALNSSEKAAKVRLSFTTFFINDSGIMPHPVLLPRPSCTWPEPCFFILIFLSFMPSPVRVSTFFCSSGSGNP